MEVRQTSEIWASRTQLPPVSDPSTWSAKDRPIFPYNSGTEARIEAPQAPEDRAW